MTVPLSAYVAESGTLIVAQPATRGPIISSVRTDPTTLLTITAVGGSFPLTVSGGTPHVIPAQSLGSAVQSALSGDTGLTGWSVAVTGNNPYTIALTRTTAPLSDPLPTITASGASLTTSLPGHGSETVTSVSGVDSWLGWHTSTSNDWSGLSIPTVGGGASVQGCYYAPAGGTGLKWSLMTLGGISGPGRVTIKASLYSQAYLTANAPSLGTLATAARYRFFDGTSLATATYRGSVTINQSTAAGSSNAWVNLATVYCSSGTILVLVTDDATANGPILIQQVSAAPYSAGLAEPSDTVVSASATTSLIGGGVPYITVNGGSQIPLTLIWTDPNQGTALSYVSARVSKIQPTDVVRLWLNASVIAFDTGANAALSGTVITNSSGTSILPNPLSGTRTAKLGIQPGNGGGFQPGDPFANHAVNADFGWTDSNADKYTLTGGLSTIQLPLDQTQTYKRLLTQEYYQNNYSTLVTGYYECLQFGVYHVITPGGADATIIGDSISVTPQAGSTTGHRIVNVQQSDPTGDVRFYLQLDQRTHLASGAPAVYGPEVSDPLNPPYWNPLFLSQVSPGGRVQLCRTKDLRNLDNNCAVTHPDDLPTRSWGSYNCAPERWRMAVASIDQAPEGAWNRSRGTGAAGTASVSGGHVTGVSVTSGGTRYDVAPRVILTGGGGTGASAHCVMSGTSVASVVIDSAGSGYTQAPTVTFGAPVRMRVNFASAHPYSNGQFVTIQVPTNGYCSKVFNLNFADGTSGAVTVGGLAYVLSSTSIILQGYTDLYDGSKAYYGKTLGTTSPSGAFCTIQLSSPPAEDAWELASHLGSYCWIWDELNTCVTAAGAYAFGGVAAANYPSGRKLIMGLSNEPWNLAFPQYSQFLTQGIEYFNSPPSPGESWPNNGDATPNANECAAWAYALAWMQARHQFTAGWVAGGRDATDLIWQINVPPYGGSWLAQVLAYIHTHDYQGKRPDDVGYAGVSAPPDFAAVATYYSVYGANSALIDEWNAMTVDQVYDYADAYLSADFSRTLLGQFDATLKATIANSPYPDLAVGSYEGGSQSVCLGMTQTHNDAMTLSYFNHPRYVRNYLTVVRALESLGYDYQIKTFSATVYIYENDGTERARCYPTYTCSTSVVGNGTANVTHIVDGSGNPTTFDPRDIVSVSGYAIQQWTAATAVTSMVLLVRAA